MRKTKEQKTKHKIPNTNSGITLIALVITIIVMLILVAVTISMAVNGGLFDYAGKATGDTQNAIDAEQTLASGKVKIDGVWYDSIDDYINNKPSEDQTGGSTEDGGTDEGDGTGGDEEEPGEEPGEEDTILPYDQTEKENGLLTANATYTTTESGKTYTAIVPEGFAIVPGLDGTTSIANGLVITDELDENGNSIGNEFVWIPVVLEGETLAEKEEEFEAIRTDGYQNGSLQTYVSGGTVTEPYSSGYTNADGTNETTEYNEMKASVIKNEGFYIGRYEAGSTTPRALYAADDETITDAQRTTEVVVKRDVYPYNYVGWGASMTDYTSNVLYTSDSTEYNQGKGALYLSKELYANKDVGVTSTLCYSIQWDAMMEFIKTEKSISNSTTWGNYSNNSLTITRTTAKYYKNSQWNAVTGSGYSKTSSTLLTTGADDSFVAKNIFDVAGNCYERTNEAYSSYRRVCRGGYYGYSGSGYPASYRNHSCGSPYYCDDSTSFRCALYIK